MDTDVLIVGAGPTGLMLAGFLTRLRIRPLVIDKKEAGAIMRDLSLVFQPHSCRDPSNKGRFCPPSRVYSKKKREDRITRALHSRGTMIAQM